MLQVPFILWGVRRSSSGLSGIDRGMYQTRSLAHDRFYVSTFPVGGCVLMRTSFVKKHNYPDVAMIKRFDDIILGDLCEQVKGRLRGFSRELHQLTKINAGKRRGEGEDEHTGWKRASADG